MSDQPWRIIAQRILTGEFTSWDVPLNGAATGRVLSGPANISGTIEPEFAQLLADDGRPVIEEWSTALFVEADGEIRTGSIVTKVETAGAARTVTASGFSSYPQGIPFMGEYFPVDFEDPIDVYRNLWAYVQSFPDGNLGLTIDSTAHSYFLLSSGDGPYRAAYYEAKDCGQELDQIAATTPFDFLEHHAWADSDHTSIDHSLQIGFPRIGRKRDDLYFEDGVNVTDIAPVGRDGEQYANDVFLLGPGEGRAMLQARAAKRDGRLRRCAVIPYKNATQGYLDVRAKQELDARSGIVDIASFDIVEHPNAPISAIQPGDDVLLHVEVPWEGDLRLWLRVLEVSESGDEPGKATIRTIRSDYFTYAPATSPTGDPVVLTF